MCRRIVHVTMYRATPTDNKICNKRWIERCQKLHKQRLKSMKPTVSSNAKKFMDNSQPDVISMPHLNVRLKKLQKESERYAEIERENTILLSKISSIMQQNTLSGHATEYIPGIRLNPNQYPIIDNVNHAEIRSLNKEYRKRQLMRITAENQSILRRIQHKEPHYDHLRWKDERKANESYLKNICEFPYRNTPRSARSGSGSSIFGTPRSRVGSAGSLRLPHKNSSLASLPGRPSSVPPHLPMGPGGLAKVRKPNSSKVDYSSLDASELANQVDYELQKLEEQDMQGQEKRRAMEEKAAARDEVIRPTTRKPSAPSDGEDEEDQEEAPVEEKEKVRGPLRHPTDRLTAEEKMKLEKVFHKFDEDNSGVIDVFEFGDLLSALGMDSSPEAVEEFMAARDTDRSGGLDFEEFATWYALDRYYSLSEKEYMSLQSIFRKFDEDNSGYIDASELQQLLMMMNKPSSPEVVKKILDERDWNDNSTIELDEFVCWYFSNKYGEK